MLKQRIITAIVLIPLFLLFLAYSSHQVFAIVTTVIVLLGAWEWAQFLKPISTLQKIFYVLLTAILLIASLFIPIPGVLLLASIWWTMAIPLIYFFPKSVRVLGRFSKIVMGLLALIPCWVALNYIHYQSDGFYTLLYLFILIWGADSFAYFAGKAFGKHKLAPTVSPGKSLEGALGALFFGLIFTAFVMGYIGVAKNMWGLGLLLSSITIIYSIIGDLTESMFKRDAKIKDSGQMIPGHGGLLDRIDSLLAAAPIFTTSILILNYFAA